MANTPSIWDKVKQAGALVGEAASESYDRASDTVKGAYQGSVSGYNGAVIITTGVKEVHVTKETLTELLNINKNVNEIILDDMATDDGYEKVRITIVEDTK